MYSPTTGVGDIYVLTFSSGDVREYVAKASGGRLGYVHMPETLAGWSTSISTPTIPRATA
jgi:hypothetical protein